MKFKKLQGVNDLINSEGPILSIVESVDDENYENERLFIKGACLNCKGYIYARVNNAGLEMFFQGRLTVKELFLLRNDELYIIEYNGKQKDVLLDERFQSRVIESIVCKDQLYYSLPVGMRLEDPFREVLKYVNMCYINGLGAHSSSILTGQRWIRENL